MFCRNVSNDNTLVHPAERGLDSPNTCTVFERFVLSAITARVHGLRGSPNTPSKGRALRRRLRIETLSLEQWAK